MKYILLLLFIGTTFSVFGQGNITKHYETEASLLVIMEEYIQQNAEDKKAKSIYASQLGFHQAIDQYLNKKSDRNYENMSILEKHSFKQNAKRNDAKLAEMIRTFNNFKRTTRNEYFSSVNRDYKLFLASKTISRTSKARKKRG